MFEFILLLAIGLACITLPGIALDRYLDTKERQKRIDEAKDRLLWI